MATASYIAVMPKQIYIFDWEAQFSELVRRLCYQKTTEPVLKRLWFRQHQKRISICNWSVVFETKNLQCANDKSAFKSASSS